ncbi:hypothetical protein [Mesorhizobium sp.]|uniref:hypothetical protein n=1 Tax=Mesorhizobium sp. TaxID=1871066 RepID=UPI000FE427DF|nr:hypothetical protein [Mesorhizobium sp.]RWN51928.1 MAG: hypothetical protein EOR98_24040 [Mesorhizobium sp.]RWN73063.1 MAG: hypothetical protein EOS02_25560 [Mesorhizobium sp.]RWN76245.1 MAG: hypothetical protein EOS01_21275 [Mesorhizobium sp.]RWN85991.1 MAG: hypothetical protein EOS04_20670 [Mesorhizobium sp.]RWO11756.1 MAG: hypothetical protein EOS15_21900 [Mesorhizobium sp.]
MFGAILGAIIGNKTIMAIFAAVVGGLWLYVAGGINRAKKEAAKQAAGKLAAAEDRLEMDREATAAERHAVGMTDADARKVATKWAKR